MAPGDFLTPSAVDFDVNTPLRGTPRRFVRSDHPSEAQEKSVFVDPRAWQFVHLKWTEERHCPHFTQGDNFAGPGAASFTQPNIVRKEEHASFRKPRSSQMHNVLHLMLSSGYRACLCGKSFTTGYVHKISNVSEDICFCCVFDETE
jgi:hypothetical protein